MVGWEESFSTVIKVLIHSFFFSTFASETTRSKVSSRPLCVRVFHWVYHIQGLVFNKFKL